MQESYLSLIVVTKGGGSTSCPYAFYDDTVYGALYIHDFDIRRMCGWEASNFAPAAVPLLCITLHDM
jgi:hypothetical protein